jgi:hypothetical protein
MDKVYMESTFLRTGIEMVQETEEQRLLAKWGSSWQFCMPSFAWHFALF